MEEEHHGMGTREHISIQRHEIKEKIRILNQEIQQFAVSFFFFFCYFASCLLDISVLPSRT